MLRLGTRGSALAMWQAQTVARRIADTGGPACEIVTIKTSGDRLQEAPLSDVGGKRLFVKEIEDALLRSEIDLAVHSSKDMPAVLPDGLTIAAVLEREDPHDAIVLPRREGEPSPTLANASALVSLLGASPVIGTSSVRRTAQLLRLFPKARFLPIRGNLDTRLRKLDSGEYQMLVLAAAGLRRLGLGDRISLTLDASTSVPSPGQGIVAIEVRTDDVKTQAVVDAINDPNASAALLAERAVVEHLGGGCQTPIGALALPTGPDELTVFGTVIALDGSRAVRASFRGPRSAAAAIGIHIAERLLESGASEILDDVRRAQAAASPRS